MTEHSSEYSRTPVPDEETVPWWRVALVAAMVAFSLPTFLTGIEVAMVVSTSQAAIALLAGSLLLSLIGSITGSIGARTRLSSYMLVRIAFGTRGASIVNAAFAVSLLGWFGVNIDLFSDAVVRLLGELLGISAPVWLVELGGGIVMTATTVYGFRAINTLSLLLVPVLITVTVLFLASSLGNQELRGILTAHSDASMKLGDAISAVVGAVIVGAVILPDITRFIRQWRGAVYTAFLSYLLVGVVVMGAGAMAAVTHANDDLLDIMIVVGLGWGAFAIVIAGSWVLNSLNLYSTVLSVEATTSALGNRQLVIVMGALGTVAAFLNILDYFLTFLFYLSVIFVPVAGVIAVDYLLVRQPAYHARRQELEREYLPRGLIAWAAGAVVSLLGAEGVIALSGIAAVDAMLISATLYYGLMWRQQQ